MRPLGIYLIGISMYILILEYDSFPEDFGRFRRFFLYGNGRTDIRTHGRTDTRMDGRTDPHTEMRGRI